MPPFNLAGVGRILSQIPMNQDGSFRDVQVKTDTRNQQTEDQKTVQYVLERVADSTRADRPFKDRALLHWMQENQVFPPDWPFWTKYSEADAVNALRKTVQGTMTPIFEKDTLCRVKAMDDQGQKETEMTQILMDYCIREHLDMKMSLYFQYRENNSFGNSVVRELVEPKRTTLSVMEPITVGAEYKIPVGMRRVEKSTTQLWPKRRNVSRFDCGPAATGATIQEMPHFHERLIWPLDRAQTAGKRAGWRNTEKLKGFFAVDRVEGYALGNWEDRNWDLPARLRMVGYDTSDGFTGPAGSNSVKYCELIMYTESPKDGTGGDRIIIIGDGQYLLWDSDWPRAGFAKGGYPYFHGLKPYSEMKFWPRNGQIWQAKGMNELMEDQVYKINALSCTAGDLIEEQRNPMKLVNRSAGVEDLSELVRQPGKILLVNNFDGIKDWISPKVPDDVWKMLEQARTQAAAIGDNSLYNHGVGAGPTGFAPGEQTMGGIAQMLQESQKAKSFLALYTERSIEEALNMILANIQQTMTGPQKLKIIGGDYQALKKAGYTDWVEVSREDIQGRFHVQVLGPSKAYDSLARAQLIQMGLEQGAKIPEVRDRIKQLKAWQIIMSLCGWEDAELVIRTDEEFAEFKRTNPPPTPQKVLESPKFEKLPPDAQADLLEKIGLPTQIGGSSPLDAHLAKAAQDSMKIDGKAQETYVKAIAQSRMKKHEPPKRFGRKPDA